MSARSARLPRIDLVVAGYAGQYDPEHPRVSVRTIVGTPSRDPAPPATPFGEDPVAKIRWDHDGTEWVWSVLP